MHILITGSKGLIGSTLKMSLETLKVTVSGLDINFFMGHPDYGDILNTSILFPLVKQVDGIVHLAAISRVVEGEKNPQLCWKTNVEGTRNILEAALASEKKPWVLFASSREVYGQQDDFPVKETASLCPLNIYGESKLEGEVLVQQARARGLQTAILRFSNVYGSVDDYLDRVVPAFCHAAAVGDKIRVEGKDHVFDFTHLEDVIDGILSLILLLIKNEISFPPIHLARGIEISLGYIAQIAKERSPHFITVIEDCSCPFRVSKFWGDPTRAEQILNWKSCISIEEGMHRLIHKYCISEGVFCCSKTETAFLS